MTFVRRAAELRAAACLALLALAAPAQALNLSEALQMAVDHDAVVAASRAQRDVDAEASASDRASRRPEVVISGYGRFSRTSSTGVFGTLTEEFPSWGGDVSLRQPLFRLDWAARGKRADALDALAETGLAERTQALFLRVAERYFAVLDARDELQRRQREAEAVSRALDDVRRRFDVELVPRNDVVEAQARDDLAQAQLLAAQRDLDNAEDALIEVIGEPPGSLPVLAESVRFPPLQPAAADAWARRAAEGSPALQQARQQVDVARADLRSQRALRAPDVDLVASATRDDTSEFQFGQRVDDTRVGLELSVPIYSGGAVSAGIRQAEAQLRLAEADALRIEREIRREARQRFREVQTAYAENDAFARALESARLALEATRNGYQAGTRTITDVLDANSRLAEAQRDLSATRHRLLLAILQLKQTAGAITPIDFQNIDALLAHAPEGETQAETGNPQ